MKSNKKHLVQKYILFFCGMVLNATGIAFITRAGLGTSPISGIPFVLSLTTSISMGMYTFLFNMLYVVLEGFIRKRFTRLMLLQIPIAIMFSSCIDLALIIIPTQYGHFYLYSVIYLLLGCVIASFGIALEVVADVIMLPAEALVRAISQKHNLGFGNTKTAFDMTLAAIALILALISFHRLNGVREGTVAAALLIGQLIKIFTRGLKAKKAQIGLAQHKTA